MDRLFSSLSATAKIIHDDEFGDIHIKRTKGATISVRPKTDGSLVASLPYFVPVREIQRLINANRDQLRIAKQKTSGDKTYRDGDLIGKSHRLHISTGPREIVKTRGLTIEITLRPDTPSVKASQLIKDGVAKALRKEAKAYLPRRLAYLAAVRRQKRRIRIWQVALLVGLFGFWELSCRAGLSSGISKNSVL